MSNTSGWNRFAARMARSLERRVDNALSSGGRGLARQVIPYRGFGTTEELFLNGRVLGNPAPGPVAASDRWWRNLANAYRHMESDEVAGARVRLRLEAHAHDTVTDEEGFYRAYIQPSTLHDSLWHEIEVLVLDHLHPDAGEVRNTGLALVPTPQVEYGVISDLDDTVIRTDATRMITMLKRTLLQNALTRLPFEGVAQFYNGLHAGSSGSALNPIFYVSSSPWNLYVVLTEFLEHHGIPLGPLTLRDWGISESGVLPRGHSEHKLAAIRQIMSCYTDMEFILIGDSGQEDPEIYRDIVHQYGKRIRAVYIRNVTPNPLRIRGINELAEEVKGAGSELLLSEDTLASVKHAAERGWVPLQTVAAVEETINPSATRRD